MTAPTALLLDAGLAVAAMPWLLCGVYLALLAACSRPRPPRASAAPASHRFHVLIPAHDEAAVIADTLESVAALDYPSELLRVTVVADNCTDHTAAIARRAGVHVLERRDASRRGKGHALAYAFDQAVVMRDADAFIVVDADTIVSRNLLTAFARRLDAGAAAVQARHAVRDGERGWRRRLMVLAFALFHDERSLARERLGLSCGLRGNGMCLARRTIEQVPWRAFSIAEDLEYGLQLGLGGVRVAYAPECVVRGAMPSTGAGARTQRARWEGGRADVARRYLVPLLRRAVRCRDASALDLAADLLVPPLTTVVLASALGTAVAALAWRLGAATVAPVALWGAGLVGIGAYVTRGCVLSNTGIRVLGDVLAAPWYMAWKLVAVPAATRARTVEWIRTTRDVEPRGSHES